VPKKRKNVALSATSPNPEKFQANKSSRNKRGESSTFANERAETTDRSIKGEKP
jgi:hypothetical protein